MFRRLAAALGGLLVLFHLWLFGSQLLDGRLTELGPVLRWLMAAGLVAALAGLHRSGGSLFRGRKAVSIWLLAALLHGPAMAGGPLTHESPAVAEVVTGLLADCGGLGGARPRACSCWPDCCAGCSGRAS